MEKGEVLKLVKLRAHVLDLYNVLDAKNEPTGIIKQSTVAIELEIAIKNIDNLLKDYVKFS